MYKIFKILLISTILISGFVYGIQSTNSSDTEYIEYRKQIVPGDTIWTICSSIATEKDNCNKSVYETTKLNKIDPAKLVPGQEIVIKIKK